MPALRFVLVRQRQHLVGHVEPVGFAGRPDAPRGKQHIDTAARAEIEHHLARIQLRQRRGIAAAERGQQRLFRDLARLRRVVEIRSDGIAATRRSGRRRNRNCLPTSPAARPLRISLSRLL